MDNDAGFRREGFAQDFDGCVVVAARYGEGEVVFAVNADVLDDHVHVDIGRADGGEDLVGDARLVGDVHDVNLGVVAAECDSGDDG